VSRAHEHAWPGAAARLYAQGAGGGLEGDRRRSGLASAWSALAAVTVLYDRKFESAEDTGVKHWNQIPPTPRPTLVACVGLIAMQRMDQALDEIREAERLDPLSRPSRTMLGSFCTGTGVLTRRSNSTGKPSRCIRTYRANVLRARVYAAQGRYRESIDTCLKAREQMDGVSLLPFLLGTLGFAYASNGNSAAAEEVRGELRQLERGCAVTAHERAVVATALGDWDTAIRELETAYEQRTGWAVWVPVEPLFDALRARACSPPVRSCERSSLVDTRHDPAEASDS